jgi:hypothetical protein
LRESLDWLRDNVTSSFEKKAGGLLSNPWLARDSYIGVVLERSPENSDKFLQEHALNPLTEEEKITVMKLLELQRHSMLMYTSCGWFFDDLAGIETVQVMSYGARVLQLARELFADELEPEFLEILGQGTSNRAEIGNGRQIYETLVRPSMFDLAKVCTHYGVGTLFNDYPERAKIYCYTAEMQDRQIHEAGRAKLALGKARITSDVTLEYATLGFAVLHMGDHNLIGGAREFPDNNSYESMVRELSRAFDSADFTETIRLLDKNFADSTFNLKSLFPDEQRKILAVLLQTTLEEVEADYRQLYEHHAPLLRFLKDAGIPPPKALHTAAEFVLNADLHRAIQNDDLEVNRIQNLLDEAQLEGITLEATSLEYSFRKAVERLARRLADEPDDFSLLEKLEKATALVRRLPFMVNLWEVQNICFGMVANSYLGYQARAQQGDEQARGWLQSFGNIAESLGVRV